MINVFKERSRTEPHQDSAASKALVKWENAGKGIRQTGFVPSVYGLALVYERRSLPGAARLRGGRWRRFGRVTRSGAVERPLFLAGAPASTDSLWESRARR